MFQIQCFLFGFICFYGIISKNDEETLSGSLIASVICLWWKTYYLAMSSLQNRLTEGKVYQSSGSSKWADWPSSKLPIDLTLINSFLVDFRVVHYEAWALGCHQPFRVLRKCTPTDARSQKKIASIDHSWAHAVFYSRRIIWCGFFPSISYLRHIFLFPTPLNSQFLFPALPISVGWVPSTWTIQLVDQRMTINTYLVCFRTQ